MALRGGGSDQTAGNRSGEVTGACRFVQRSVDLDRPNRAEKALRWVATRPSVDRDPIPSKEGLQPLRYRRC
jgi:hypothetical protein